MTDETETATAATPAAESAPITPREPTVDERISEVYSHISGINTRLAALETAAGIRAPEPDAT